MDRLQRLKQETLDELTRDILPFWERRMQDGRGGFHGRIDGEGRLDPKAPKGAILNARILWTFSAAYRQLGDPAWEAVARNAFLQIRDRFHDPEYGGVFWSLDPEGRPLDTKKQFYAIAFSIYGLSEYFRATGEEEALELAIRLFRDIERHSLDTDKGGYLEAAQRDWSPISDMRLSDKDRNDAKTMNTHLHILEGYTALYRVWKDEDLRQSLTTLVELFLDHIARPDGHLGLFFDENWVSQSEAVSYGHEIETSWLLLEAAATIEGALPPYPLTAQSSVRYPRGSRATDIAGFASSVPLSAGRSEERLLNHCDRNQLLSRVQACSMRLAEAALEGLQGDGSLIYEADPETGAVDAERHWWVQAETVVGCLYQARLRGGDPVWLERALACWAYIREHLICPDGEWYWSARPDGTPNTADDRAGFWKCPYHNGRMCLEILERV